MESLGSDSKVSPNDPDGPKVNIPTVQAEGAGLFAIRVDELGRAFESPKFMQKGGMIEVMKECRL